uniref:Uncharacterized protein n=1 Tax=Molossus molossus TaxID=27622 RepID=A0A7J8CS26_MOLMO|nr:hypothetical protein HJG59_009822 [Molossus molossus]
MVDDLIQRCLWDREELSPKYSGTNALQGCCSPGRRASHQAWLVALLSRLAGHLSCREKCQRVIPGGSSGVRGGVGRDGIRSAGRRQTSASSGSPQPGSAADPPTHRCSRTKKSVFIARDGYERTTCPEPLGFRT